MCSVSGRKREGSNPCSPLSVLRQSPSPLDSRLINETWQLRCDTQRRSGLNDGDAKHTCHASNPLCVSLRLWDWRSAALPSLPTERELKGQHHTQQNNSRNYGTLVQDLMGKHYGEHLYGIICIGTLSEADLALHFSSVIWSWVRLKKKVTTRQSPAWI